MNNKEMRLSRLLRDYMGAHSTSIKALSTELGINPATLNGLLEGKQLISTLVTAKLLYWLFTPVDKALPKTDPVPVTPPIPEISMTTTTNHRVVGKVVQLSPRMQALVNRQKGNK